MPVPYARSDIDFVAMREDLSPFYLSDGTHIGTRVIVEVKTEHDWVPCNRVKGRAFGHAYRSRSPNIGR